MCNKGQMKETFEHRIYFLPLDNSNRISQLTFLTSNAESLNFSSRAFQPHDEGLIQYSASLYRWRDRVIAGNSLSKYAERKNESRKV
jgi:hypothetical protein